MTRLLVVGEQAEETAGRLSAAAGPGWELRAVRLPAAALRTLEDWSPDAVVLAVHRARRNAWTEALRDRPLGQLVPMVLLGDDSTGGSNDEAPRVDRMLATDVPPRAVLDAVEAELAERPSSGSEHTDSSQDIERKGYTLQPLDDGAESSGGTVPPPATEPAVERKLDEVRHSDYFKVLEVDATAERPAIQRAYRRLKRQFARHRLDDALLNEHEDVIDEIHEALDDALAVLSEESLRSAYVNARKRK